MTWKVFYTNGNFNEKYIVILLKTKFVPCKFQNKVCLIKIMLNYFLFYINCYLKAMWIVEYSIFSSQTCGLGSLQNFTG